MLPQKKTNCNPLVHPIWKCHPLTCKMQNFFIWLKVCCVPSNVGGSEKKPVVGWHWWLWKEPVVMCGNWDVGQATSQQVFTVTTFCMDTCFLSFSTLISRTVHHSVLKFSPCRNKLLPHVRINTRAPPVSWSTTVAISFLLRYGSQSAGLVTNKVV